jgi:hypothetical protein
MDPIAVGLEVFQIQQALGYGRGISQEEALTKAIKAAVIADRRGYIQTVRDDILEKAEELDDDAENDMFEDGPAALLWYAKILDDLLPPEHRLENNDV